MGSHRVGHDWGDLAAAAAAVRLGVLNKGRGEFIRQPEHLERKCFNH